MIATDLRLTTSLRSWALVLWRWRCDAAYSTMLDRVTVVEACQQEYLPEQAEANQ